MFSLSAVLDASSPRTHHPHCRVDGDVVDIDIVSPTHGRRVAPTLRALCLRDSRGFDFVSLAVSATVRVPVTPEMRARSRDEEDDGAAGGRAWGQRAAPPFSPDWGGGGRWRGRRLRIGAARSAATRFGDLPFVRGEAFSSKARPETAHGGGAQRHHCSFSSSAIPNRARRRCDHYENIVRPRIDALVVMWTPTTSSTPMRRVFPGNEDTECLRRASRFYHPLKASPTVASSVITVGDEYMYRRPASEAWGDGVGDEHMYRRPGSKAMSIWIAVGRAGQRPPHLELRPSISDRETPRSFISDAPRLPAAPGAERRSNVSPSDEQALRRARLSLDGDLPISYMATVQQLRRRCSGVLTMLGAYSEL
ncbi:hypothetical protein BD626DRAFT_539224 [Schizophyllum amplum]|uniref:Uncharacterized protein n=1 Tax=Schizophyllum amplum TaxID=97359 RepID=A0A550C4R3_9AGAR|nr:hypothetical protein BD626DRAFT_539224 [Auriculariopsis ampla]